MFAFAIVEHATGTRDAGPRPARHQAALPGRDARPAALRLDPAGAARGRRRRHLARPGRAAALHDASTRWCRRRARSSPACASCRRPRSGSIEPTARSTETRLLGGRRSPATPTAARPRASGRDAVWRALRTAVERRMVADVPVGRAAVRRARLQLHRRAAGRAGAARADHVQHRVRGGGRRERRRVRLLRPHRQAVRHRCTTRSGSAPSASCRPWTRTVAAMSEPMVSHDCVAFYLLSEDVSKHDQGGAVGAGRRRDLRRLQLVPAAGRRAARDGPSTRTPGSSSIVRTASWPGSSSPEWLLDADVSREFVAAQLRPRPAPTDRAWTRRCAWTRRSCWSTTRSSGSTT